MYIAIKFIVKMATTQLWASVVKYSCASSGCHPVFRLKKAESGNFDHTTQLSMVDLGGRGLPWHLNCLGMCATQGELGTCHYSFTVNWLAHCKLCFPSILGPIGAVQEAAGSPRHRLQVKVGRIA